MNPKPQTPNVFCRPIPNSAYSIRLFPGSITQGDEVQTESGKPVNSPLGFEIWSTRDPGVMPWLGGGTARVCSLEHALGFRGASIEPRAEKFVLRDGQTCLLKRPGHTDVQFTVPVRAEGLNLERPDMDHLDFPGLV